MKKEKFAKTLLILVTTIFLSVNPVILAISPVFAEEAENVENTQESNQSEGTNSQTTGAINDYSERDLLRQKIREEQARVMAERRANRDAERLAAIQEALKDDPYFAQLNSVGAPQNNQTSNPEDKEVSLGDLSASNSKTGADSLNDASTTTENSLNFNVDNNYNADNYAYVNVDTGKNSADKNTGDGQVVSGDADLILTALNVGNNTGVGSQVFNIYDDQTGDMVINFDNVSSIPLGYVCGGGQATNSTTGSDSANDATTNCTSQNSIIIDNNGNIVNDFYLSADTGHNTADKNTGDGSVTTGDVNVVLNVVNFINNTFLGGGGELLLGLVNIFGNLDGNILLNVPKSGDDVYYSGGSSSGNSTTGAGSANTSTTSTENETNISLINNSDILNNIMLFAETGDNTADMNTGSGSINTGNVNTNLNVANIGNTNGIGDGGTLWMVLVNNLGEWSGQIWGFDSTGIASPFFNFSIGDDGSFNTITGAESSNTASTSSTNKTNVSINNNAGLTNNIYINANSGGNSASMNTGSGSVTTGDVNVAANVLNILNNNFLASKFVLTIVNVFGSWTGSIFPEGEGPEPKGGILADENSSISFGVNNSGNESNSNSSYGFNIGSPINPNNSSNVGSEGKADKGEVATALTTKGGSAKVDSVTKVIGKDARSLLDYWWIVIPLLIATSSALYKRRFQWMKQ